MKKRVALCVAEKPTVAKSVSEFLSKGRFNKVLSENFTSVVHGCKQVQPDLRIRLHDQWAAVPAQGHFGMVTPPFLIQA